MRCHLMDVLPHIGGQLTEIYPKKPIYDIPGFPQVLAGDLIHHLKKQIEPFKPGFTLGERADTIEKLEHEADLAIYERRNFAVEQERKIKESELNTEIAVEEKQKQIAEKRMESDVQKAENDRRLREMKVQADISVENQRKQLIGES